MAVPISDRIYRPCQYCGKMTEVSKSEIHFVLARDYVVVCEEADCYERGLQEMGYQSFAELLKI